MIFTQICTCIRTYFYLSLELVILCYKLYNPPRGVVEVHDGRIGVQADGMKLVAVLHERNRLFFKHGYIDYK